MLMSDFHRKILNALAATPDGTLSTSELKKLYDAKGDGQRNATMVKNGWTEWVRGSNGVAKAIRITAAGRSAIEIQEDGMGKITDDLQLPIGRTVLDEIDQIKADNERLRAALKDMIERVKRSWDRRDLAPDGDLEAVEHAKEALRRLEQPQ
jgi:hypothetical protein